MSNNFRALFLIDYSKQIIRRTIQKILPVIFTVVKTFRIFFVIIKLWIFLSVKITSKGAIYEIKL